MIEQMHKANKLLGRAIDEDKIKGLEGGAEGEVREDGRNYIELLFHQFKNHNQSPLK